MKTLLDRPSLRTALGPIATGAFLFVFFTLPASSVRADGESALHGCGDFADECPDAYAESRQEWPEIFETYPDGSLPEPTSEPEFSAFAVSGPIAPAAGQPPGVLSGRIVYTSAGHGWTKGTSSWFLQRPLLLEMNEDYGNLDQMNMFAQYVFNAGATVVAFRPLGNQRNEVVLDNVDSEVIWSGSWNNSSQTKYFGNPGEVPYRWASLSSTETATATYVPDIPEAGFYPVYTWVLHGSDRTFQLYRIRHTGGESEVRVPHHMVGNGWIYLGNYYFEAGSNPATGAVIISNLRPSPTLGSVVIADAIRFGNGMSTDGSTYPKEEEASRYWVKNSLGVGQDATIYDRPTLDDAGDNVGTPPRMALEMNRAASSPIFKSIYLGFHTNAGSGNSRGSLGLHNANHDRASTPNQFRWAQLVGQEVNDQMVAMSPFLEVPWFNRSVVTLSRSDIAFGEINNRTINGAFDATIIESGYHDNALDARILRDPKARNWIARACYRAIVKYMNEFDGVPLIFLPEPPRNIRAVASGSNGITVSWDVPAPSAGSGAPASYIVYRSTDGYGFGHPTLVSGGTTTSVTLNNLPADTDLYFRVAARNAGGESFPSETVGCRRPSTSGGPRVLFVNGYNRFDRHINMRQTPSSGNYRPPGHNANTGVIDRVLPRSVNSFDYVVQHGRAINAAEVAFDSCSSNSIVNNQITLTNYDIVVWASGQNSVAQRTFTTTAQSRVSTFLNNNGALFVSGSDIAFDLDRPSGPSPGDRTFLRDFLRVGYTTADSTGFTATPAAGTLFAGLLNATFDSGPGRIYPVRLADTIIPVGAGTRTGLNYTAGGGVAAVQYDGSAGGGKVVFMSFPFETILNPAVRNQYMASILGFLNEPVALSPPVILAQPESITVMEEAHVILTVEASGVPAPDFQWQLNGVDILGEVSPTLTFSPVQVADGGSYQVIVSNSLDSVTSETAVLTVFAVPPKPVFNQVLLDDDGALEAVLLGNPGTWFLVETSENLLSWSPLTTVRIDQSPASFLDRNWHTFERRFYRGREVPVFAFTDFQSFADGAAVMFRQPSFSGSTNSHIATGGDLPNFTNITTNFPSETESSKVLHASWSFASETSNPWLRLTTFNASNIPNPTVNFSHGIRMRVYVDRPIYLALGLRETNSAAPIGQDGGTTGDIEAVGGRTNNNVSPPLGKLIPPGEWVTVHYFLPFEPVRAQAGGNGILESTTGKGVLENLTIVPADGTGTYNLYLDNFRTIELFP